MAVLTDNLNLNSDEPRRQRIAAFFRKRRGESGLSLEIVARELGYEDSSIVAEYEAGTRDIPLEDIFALTNLLNIAPEDVMSLVHNTYKEST